MTKVVLPEKAMNDFVENIGNALFEDINKEKETEMVGKITEEKATLGKPKTSNLSAYAESARERFENLERVSARFEEFLIGVPTSQKLDPEMPPASNNQSVSSIITTELARINELMGIMEERFKRLNESI